MLRLTVFCLVSVFLLPCLATLISQGPVSALTGSAQAWASADQTDLMQQSDHKQRAAKHTTNGSDEQQMAGVIPPDSGTGNGDYLLLGLLVASLVILAFIASNRKRMRLRR